MLILESLLPLPANKCKVIAVSTYGNNGRVSPSGRMTNTFDNYGSKTFIFLTEEVFNFHHSILLLTIMVDKLELRSNFFST